MFTDVIGASTFCFNLAIFFGRRMFALDMDVVTEVQPDAVVSN